MTTRSQGLLLSSEQVKWYAGQSADQMMDAYPNHGKEV